jgi:hypothetical protein
MTVDEVNASQLLWAKSARSGRRPVEICHSSSILTTIISCLIWRASIPSFAFDGSWDED